MTGFPGVLRENQPSSILPARWPEANASGGRAGGHSQVSEAHGAKNCVGCSGSVFASILQGKRTGRMYVYAEIYYTELAHMIMDTDKSQDLSQQAGGPREPK